MNKLEVLQNCIVEGNIVKLPNEQVDRKVYLEVKKALELIGGKWKGGKVFGFVFQEDPSENLQELQNGGNKNLKKEYQFFATPNDLADYLVELSDVSDLHEIEEPSAGQGAIVESIRRHVPDADIDCVELMPLNAKILRAKNIADRIYEGDYLNMFNEDTYDRIIANPPFSKNQDIAHIKHMYSRLSPNGRLVSCSSTSWFTGSQKKQIAFREWLKEINAEILDIEPGTFKESGTMVGGKIIIINK